MGRQGSCRADSVNLRWGVLCEHGGAFSVCLGHLSDGWCTSITVLCWSDYIRVHLKVSPFLIRIMHDTILKKNMVICYS
jgi:hypothetical protein